MRRWARGFFVLVLLLDVAFVLTLLTGGSPVTRAQSDSVTGSIRGEVEPDFAQTPGQTRWTREALQLLGRELSERAQVLDQRQRELEEMARGIEVLKRAALEPEPAEAETDDATTEGAPSGAAQTNATTASMAATATVRTPQSSAATTRPVLDAAARQELFTRLRKTYENMEPESAAAALSQLAVLDKGAVVELILGWKPRVAGAVLDALTLSDPALAADLSYGIWLRSGKNRPDPQPTP